MYVMHVMHVTFDLILVAREGPDGGHEGRTTMEGECQIDLLMRAG